MHKKYEINRTKIKGDCQSGRKVVTHNSKSDLPLVMNKYHKEFSKVIFPGSFFLTSLEPEAKY